MAEPTRHQVAVNGIRLQVTEAGSGPPVILLHGFPETSYGWRHQIPPLAERYHVIAPDLRGYGDSDKPYTGYDKRNMAQDIKELAQHYGYERIALVGHDRGARVATRFAKDHRDAIDRLVVMDNVPTRVVLDNISSPMLKYYWFFYFQQVPDLPEALIAGREDVYIRHFFRVWTTHPTAMSDEDIDYYARKYAEPGVLRGALSDYRAGPTDFAQDTEDADQLIDCPTLAMWGTDFDGVGGGVGGSFDMRDVWAGMAKDVRCVPIERAGHLLHEEQPEAVTAELLKFLDGWEG
jgi:pimeloyl-ACP methyl ester carboxylesterase